MSASISCDVVFALTGDVYQNSRALRQLRALRKLGCKVLVLSLGQTAGESLLEEGISVRTLPHPQTSGPRFFWRVHRLFSESADVSARVYHASDLYSLPAMWSVSHRHTGNLVYDARELYPHVAATVGRPWIRMFWSAIERFYIRGADAVFTVSESIADRLAKAYHIEPPVVLHNIPPARQVKRSDKLQALVDAKPDTVIVLHQGQMRADRGCSILIDVMPHIHNAILVFLGNGPLKPVLVEKTNSMGLQDRVKFLPAVPPDELLAYTASADIGVTLLENTCLNHRFALPNKLFEYMMAGVPVLASDLPEIRNVIRSYDVGNVVDPSDPQALKRTLQDMIDDETARRRWAKNTSNALKDYSWERESERFLTRYKALIQTSPSYASTRK